MKTSKVKIAVVEADSLREVAQAEKNKEFDASKLAEDELYKKFVDDFGSEIIGILLPNTVVAVYPKDKRRLVGVFSSELTQKILGACVAC